MDRYLFRGLRVNGDGMVSGNLDITHYGEYFIKGHTGERYAYAVDPATIGQCTGYKDKNGSLIFEGDVIRHEHYGDNHAHLVKWVDGGFMVCNMGIYGGLSLPNYTEFWETKQREDGSRFRTEPHGNNKLIS